MSDTETGQQPAYKVRPVAKRTFGTPGDSLAQTFGERGATGARAEQITADVLARIAADHDDLYIFHGLRLPNQAWDVDHLVLYRGQVFLIDDKQWESNSHYTLTDHVENDGSVSGYLTTALRDEEYFPGNTLKPRWYEHYISQYLPDYQITNIVTIHGRNITTLGNEARYGFILNRAVEDLETDLRARLAAVTNPGPNRTSQSYTVLQLGKLVNVDPNGTQPTVPFPIRAPQAGLNPATAPATTSTGYAPTTNGLTPTGFHGAAPFNTLVIVAFVVSLIAVLTEFLLLPNIAAIILANIANNQIRRRGERGRGLAIAALIMAYVSILGILLSLTGYLSIIGTVIGNLSR